MKNHQPVLRIPESGDSDSSPFEDGSRIELSALMGPAGAGLAVEIEALTLADLSVGGTVESSRRPSG